MRNPRLNAKRNAPDTFACKLVPTTAAGQNLVEFQERAVARVLQSTRDQLNRHVQNAKMQARIERSRLRVRVNDPCRHGNAIGMSGSLYRTAPNYTRVSKFRDEQRRIRAAMDKEVQQQLMARAMAIYFR